MTSKAIRSAGLWCLPLVLLALVSALSSSPARAADPQPVLVYQNPAEGQVLQQAAFGIQLCFASPVNIKDLDKGGDFAFTVTEPDGLGLGNRDVFQVDGYGITVYPGKPIGGTTGQWKFHYRLTSPDAQSALEGDINYTVDPNGSPLPQATPPSCVASGGTATASPTPAPGATTPAALSASPAPASRSSSSSATPTVAASPVSTSGNPSVSATPTVSPIAAGSSGSGPDILKYALLTIGAAGAAGVILLIGYFVRRRVGYDPHREKPGDGDDHH
jgi:hypothetical protein